MYLPSASYESGYTDALDIVGFSYRQVVYDYCHENYPDKPILGTENLGQWHEWKAVMEREFVSGIFIWTGVDYLIGSHVSDKAADDPAVVIPGSHGSLATTKYDVFFHGVSAHAGGSPEKGKNVMPAVATAILNLYGIPRNSAGMSRINVGTVVAGSGRNVIADVAKMEIEVRGETTEINQYMEEYAKNIIECD